MQEKGMNPKSETLNNTYKHEALEMAIADFEKFCKYSGVNQTQLKVCIERNKGLSIRRIAMKLEIPRSTVKDICDRCFEESYKESTKEEK